MKIYKNDCTDPYFNLAAEQYLLDTAEGEIFMLWRNERSVIIGKNQNAFSEINRGFIEANGIKAVRRLTGGGAVFHDLGNLNFTFIKPHNKGDELDFAGFSMPIIKALRGLGIDAELSGRNDITVCGKKISGNAETVYNGKVMHHGTLLFSSDFSEMEGALNVDPEKIKSKGIKSVRSRVANLSEYLPDRDVLWLRDYLEAYIDGEKTEFSEADKAAVEQLKNTKYSTWEWNFGTSKALQKHNKKRFGYGSVEVSFTADCGVIKEISILGDFFGECDITELEEKLVGARLDEKELEERLYGVGRYVLGAKAEDIANIILN